MKKQIEAKSLARMLACALFIVIQTTNIFAQANKAKADSISLNPPVAKAIPPAINPVSVPDARAPSDPQLELIKLLALGPADGRAVLQFPDKQMVSLKVGDVVPGTHAVLIQVLTDKLILEETTSTSQGKQVVWMHKAAGTAPGRIERFSSLASPTFVQHPQAELVVASPPVDAGAAMTSRRKKQ